MLNKGLALLMSIGILWAVYDYSVGNFTIWKTIVVASGPFFVLLLQFNNPIQKLFKAFVESLPGTPTFKVVVVSTVYLAVWMVLRQLVS